METCTPGSAGGSGKRTDRKISTALWPDPTQVQAFDVMAGHGSIADRQPRKDQILSAKVRGRGAGNLLVVTGASDTSLTGTRTGLCISPLRAGGSLAGMARPAVTQQHGYIHAGAAADEGDGDAVLAHRL
jgi:hypothetical protein